MRRQVEVETKFGTLRAYAGTDPNYPEIFVDLIREHSSLSICVVADYSASADEMEEEPYLRIAVYGDSKQEDYTDCYKLVQSDIDAPDARWW